MKHLPRREANPGTVSAGPMPRPNPFKQPNVLARLIEQHQAGMTIRALAKEFRASGSTVMAALTEAGIAPHPGPAEPKLPEPILLAAELAAPGIRQVEVARHYGTSRQAIYQRLRAGGFDPTQPLWPQIEAAVRTGAKENRRLGTIVANVARWEKWKQAGINPTATPEFAKKRAEVTGQINREKPRRRGAVPTGYLTPKQASEQSGKSLARICKLIRDGRLPAERRSFGWIIPVEALKGKL